MNSLALTYAVLAGVSMATYIIALRLAGPGTHPALGTAVVTGVAFAINVPVALSVRALGTPLAFATQSLWLLGVVGLATATVNLFTLAAYTNGLKVTSSFIIGGISTILVLLVGFLFLREPFRWTKLFAIALIAIGTFVLQRVS